MSELALGVAVLGAAAAGLWVFAKLDTRRRMAGWTIVIEPEGQRWLLHRKKELLFKVNVYPGAVRFEDHRGRYIPNDDGLHNMLLYVWRQKGGFELEPQSVTDRREAIEAVLTRAGEPQRGALSLVNSRSPEGGGPS